MTTETNRSEHPIKKATMVWVWRVQQVAQISTLIMMSISLTLQIAGKIQWRFGSPYAPVVFTFMLLAFVLLSLGYLWDKKARMWHEQAVVGIERNPYAELKMGPKEVFSNQVLWIPLFDLLGNSRGSHILEKWTDEQLEADPALKIRVNRLREHFDDMGSDVT